MSESDEDVFAHNVNKILEEFDDDRTDVRIFYTTEIDPEPIVTIYHNAMIKAITWVHAGDEV